jgi:hypothetical protein
VGTRFTETYVILFVFFFFENSSEILFMLEKTIKHQREGEISSLLTIPQIQGGIEVYLIVSMTWVLAATASSCAATFNSL